MENFNHLLINKLINYDFLYIHDSLLEMGLFIMQTLKESVIRFLKNQSDDVNAEDIIEFVIMNQKLAEGEKDLQEGRIYTHDQAKEILKR
nr:hypothetical protein DSAG12_02215 [Candidatus Prometheoarchaeum syntrophicum]